MRKNLVLLGMMVVGKSTIGKIVAKKQNLKFIDTDVNIEKNVNLFKCDKLIIANLLFDKLFWRCKINFIKQKYS